MISLVYDIIIMAPQNSSDQREQWETSWAVVFVHHLNHKTFLCLTMFGFIEMPIQKGKSRYKYGKQMQIIEFPEIVNKVKAARKHLTKESEAYFWLLYWCGVRKSEAYERITDDIEITETHFIIDFHKRKKGGLAVPPLKLPRVFPGVDILCEQLRKARKRKPTWKQIKPPKEKPKRMKARWLFPHINRTWAGVIVKRILGEKYYPHFLRLNRISELCTDPTSNIARISSFTGIKTLRIIEYYLGASTKEQDAAINFMAKQISSSQKK